MYESLYDVADDVVKTVNANLFLFSSVGPIVEVIPIQKQATNSNNCRVFAIAVCVAILEKRNPYSIVFKEDEMKSL